MFLRSTYKRSRPAKRSGCFSIIIAALLVKCIWVVCATWDNGTFKTEKKDILHRRDYLLSKTIVEPHELLDEMPRSLGPQFQGEWALYTCSMLAAAMTNIAYIYPETKSESIHAVDSLINIVLSPEIREYDKVRWGEDALKSLDGHSSHISYLSHLAWMISGYKNLGGTNKYDKLFHDICRTMNRRIMQSPNMNLQTYPREPIYIPDMLVAIVALSNYSKLYNGKYSSTVRKWVQKAKTEWLDDKTGLLVSFLPDEGMSYPELPVKGSYSALNCYYLTFIDAEFAKEQYEHMVAVFRHNLLITGFKEYTRGIHLLGMDVDAGPIILGLSPSGTAFAVGSVTYFEDFKLRKKLLKTAEIAGSTITWKGKRHYMLSGWALVGEAIMLNMRTAISWKRL